MFANTRINTAFSGDINLKLYDKRGSKIYTNFVQFSDATYSLYTSWPEVIFVYAYLSDVNLLVLFENMSTKNDDVIALYVVMSGDQSAGRSHNMKFDNSSFGKVEQFKYLEATLKYQNSIQEDIKNRFRSGVACYHSVQNVLSYIMLS